MNDMNSKQEIMEQVARLIPILPEDAEKELATFFSYLVYKYNLELNSSSSNNFKILDSVPDGVKHPIDAPDFVMYSREELHERAIWGCHKQNLNS